MMAVSEISFSATDIERSGVAGLPFLAALRQSRTNRIERATILFDVADSLSRQGRPIDALAALRVARRLHPNHKDIETRLSNYLGCAPNPTGWQSIMSVAAARVQFPDIDQQFNIQHRSFNYINNIRLSIQGMHFDDLSFVVVRNKQPIALIICSIFADGMLDCFQNPIDVEFAPGLSAENMCSVFRAVIPHLATQARAFGAPGFTLADHTFLNGQSACLRSLARYTFTSEVYTRLFVDLTQDESVIWKGIRNSYKPIINKGERMIRLTVLRRSLRSLEKEIIEILSKSHEPDGMRLRAYIEAAERGQGEFCAAVVRGARHWCGITGVLYDGDTAIYGFGGFDRSACEIEVGHYMVHQAILRAKARGLSAFYLTNYQAPKIRMLDTGVLYKENAKLQNIRFFKSGFTETVERRIVYRVFL